MLWLLSGSYKGGLNVNTEKDISYNNPFPITAVANFYNDLQNDMIVETKAIKKLKDVVEKWLSQKKDGATIAVQGEFGTGKTQLAIELQRHLTNENESYHFICLDSPANSFLHMYKNRFLGEIKKEQVLERLDAYYSDIIIEDMKQNIIFEKLLEHKICLKSKELVRRFGLPKSQYDLQFENKLKGIVKNHKFVPALQLLLENRFEKDVWNWFGGTEPSEALRERGVQFTIDNDESALESIGVFAYLFGEQGHKFILFIDEMEKLLSSNEKVKAQSSESLKKLIEIVKETKSLLIICGLPDYYIALPRDLQQRIAYQIKTEAITTKEIMQYVCNANKKVNNQESTIPFSEKILEDIINISEGNIRMIIRLLYHSGNWYLKNGLVINEKALCEVLENAYGVFDLKDVRKVLEQTIISKGWLYEVNKKSDDIVIDFWLPSILTHKASLQNGIEIYLIPNLISKDDFSKIKVQNSNANNCKIFIIEGFISDCYYKSLLEISNHVLKYREPGFKEIFINLIEGEKSKFENKLKQNDLRLMNEKIEQLTRIVTSSINELNENAIGKQEFYYFARKFFDISKEEIYQLPDKDSECYLLIKQVHELTIKWENGGLEKDELGRLYLLRDFSYILYYLLEKPEKLQIYRKQVEISSIGERIYHFSKQLFRNCSSMLNDALDKYRFILQYLCRNYYETKDVVFRHITNEQSIFMLGLMYDVDLFSVSNKLKQINQNFCAELLIAKPNIIERYEQIFVAFYHIMYAIEPGNIRREDIVEYDLSVLREYYDLFRRYYTGYNQPDFRESFEKVFEIYEYSLRRMRYDREF